MGERFAISSQAPRWFSHSVNVPRRNERECPISDKTENVPSVAVLRIENENRVSQECETLRNEDEKADSQS